MTSELDDYNKSIIEDMKSVYTETVIDHAINPRNAGSITDPDGYAGVTGSCGDTIQLWLRVNNKRVVQATFWTDGCAATIASGSMATEMAKGKSILEAMGISQQEILDALGGLPEGNLHCALLAANTLKEAVKDYLAFQREPWKKAYRKHLIS